MTTMGRLASVLVALTILGCKGPVQTSAEGAGEGASAGSSGEGASTGSASGGATRKVYITDPSLDNMKASEVTIPANWHFQGMLYQGGKCVQIPQTVWRATSPDGLSFVEQMPPLGWAWGTGPIFGNRPKNNECLPMKGPMSAQDFLKYLSATLQVEYVADESMTEENAKLQQGLHDRQASGGGNSFGPPLPTQELAQAVVRYKNGTFAMKGELGVLMTCNESKPMRLRANDPPSTSDQCTAVVSYGATTEGLFAMQKKMWSAPGMGDHTLDPWLQAWLQRSQQQSAQMISQLSQQQAAQRQAGAQQFAHDQAVRQGMHEEFLSTMQAGTDRSMARAAQVANTNHTMASDWVDYSLDQRTVIDPNTGQFNKVSNQSESTWANNSGQIYQAKDPAANPNGVIPGTWTRQNAAHGDGTQ